MFGESAGEIVRMHKLGLAIRALFNDSSCQKSISYLLKLQKNVGAGITKLFLENRFGYVIVHLG